MPNNKNHEVLINEKLFKEIKQDTVNLEVGCMTTVSKISKTSEDNKLIYLNPTIAKKLLVPSQSYLPYYFEDNLIKLGPSVGVLTSNKNQNNPIPKGKKGRLLKEMISYGQKNGLFIFFFYAEGVNWKNKLIKGYSLNNQGKWISGNYAFPNIIYNRIQYRSIEGKNHVKTLLQKFTADPKVYLFNSRFLNKWEVNEILSNFPAGQKFIPETMKFNRTNLRLLLQKHKEVFLKPINSSRGQGIVKIISNSNNSYQYSKAEAANPKWNLCTSFYNLSEALSRIGVKENRYLIQEGIDLATINERVFDLRSQVQKDGNGKWVMTGVGVRIAGRDRFVTHIPNGGTAASYEEVIKKTFANNPGIRASIDQQLKTITTVIPPRLEEGLGLNLAILSLDIGVDNLGNLWILEINSKPASFDEDEIRFKHLQYLTNYFIFAAQKIVKE